MESQNVELRDFLCSLAKRFTKNQYMDGMKGSKSIRDLDDQAGRNRGKKPTSGLLVTLRVPIKGFDIVHSEAEIDAVLEELESDYSVDIGVSRDLDYIRFSRILPVDEVQIHDEEKILELQNYLIERIAGSADEYRHSLNIGQWPNFKEWLKRFITEEVDMWNFEASFKDRSRG